MSTATHAHPGKLTLGSLLTRIFVIVLIWAGLVYGLIHYVGHVIPTAYQDSLAAEAAADLKAHEAANPPAASGAAKPATASAAASAPAMASATPAASFAAAAPAAPSPAASAAPAPAASPASAAGSAAPASSAPAVAAAPKASGEKKLPVDVRLAGLNRTALTNVSIFFSIVASVYCLGAIILQLFKYCHKEEEEAAH